MPPELSADSVAAVSVLDPPTARRRAGHRPASVLLRLQVLVHRGQLDRLLAEGRSPTTDPRLAVRAAQLARLAVRARVAAGLRDAVRSIDETALTLRLRPQVPVDVASVRACASEIGELARALTDLNPRVRGVAIARELLTDGAGPLYTGQADQLRNTLLTARSAL